MNLPFEFVRTIQVLGPVINRSTRASTTPRLCRFVGAALLPAGYDPGDREGNAFYRERSLPTDVFLSAADP
jgi:hypothetical protein